MRYAQYFQKKTSGSGHVWQGRFYSCLLYGGHLMEAVRYVELNPVRAGIVHRAWDYPWSSARAHLGKKYKWVMLSDIREILEVRDWRKYLLEKSDRKFQDGIRAATKKNLVFGPPEFLVSMEKRLKCRIIANSVGRPKK